MTRSGIQQLNGWWRVTLGKGSVRTHSAFPSPASAPARRSPWGDGALAARGLVLVDRGRLTLPLFQILIQIVDASSVITWDFDVCKGDIVFNIYHSKRSPQPP